MAEAKASPETKEAAKAAKAADVEEVVDEPKLDEELEEYFKARHGIATHRYNQLGRDEEAGVAEKLGEGPHPEVANPKPPKELQGYPGVGVRLEDTGRKV